MKCLWLVAVLAACGHRRPQQSGGDARQHRRRCPRRRRGGLGDGGAPATAAAVTRGRRTSTGRPRRPPRATTRDRTTPPPATTPPTGIITGGPCLRVRRARPAIASAGRTAAAPRRWTTRRTACPTTRAITPRPTATRSASRRRFVDPFLGDGGVALDDSDFIDIELSTAGISSISKATLVDLRPQLQHHRERQLQLADVRRHRLDPDDFVSNVAPYQWYSADMTTAISPGETVCSSASRAVRRATRSWSTGSSSASSPSSGLDFLPAPAADQVIVDEPARLHVRVHDRRAGELEAALLQRPSRARRTASTSPGSASLVFQRFTTGLPSTNAPDELVERAELRLTSSRNARALLTPHVDLLAVAHDARVEQELLDLRAA